MKLAISKLDKLFSEYIRQRAMLRVHGCERCLTPKYDIQKDNGGTLPSYKQLQCSHFWGRARKSVRFDEDNAAGLCAGCHMFFTAHPYEHTRFFLERLGQEKYDELMLRANGVHNTDLAAIEIYLRQKTKELQVSVDKL